LKNPGKRNVSRGFLRSWYRSITHPNCPQLTVICTDCQILVQTLVERSAHRLCRFYELLSLAAYLRVVAVANRWLRRCQATSGPYKRSSSNRCRNASSLLGKSWGRLPPY